MYTICVKGFIGIQLDSEKFLDEYSGATKLSLSCYLSY